MPIYSPTYLNTSTMELNPQLYHCTGSMHSEVSGPGTRPPTQQRGRGLLSTGSSVGSAGGGRLAAPFCTYRSFIRHTF